MGFSGKPSKGCLPCRQKRTKCDLALPSCTQCLRKNRMCFGYRNEQDMVFRNETGLVIEKIKRKKPSTDDAFATLDIATLIRHPSRRPALQDEAIMHWLSNFNERFFSSNCELPAGFSYIMPVYQNDLKRGGPTVEIINACALAALGNSKNAPDLLRTARVKQVKVLRHLNEQLQDSEHALSDSSVLTCLLLSSFENIMCEGTHSMAASQIHIQGAATLMKQRGDAQFSDLLGHAMFVRMRGNILALCLMKSDPFPSYCMPNMKREKLREGDFEVTFHRIISRVCALRSQQKQTGSVSDVMAAEANSLLDDIHNWRPTYPTWVMPAGHRSFTPGIASGPVTDAASSSASAKTERFLWISSSWLMFNIGRLLLYEILIVHFRTRAASETTTAAEDETALRAATAAQNTFAEDIQDAVAYYFDMLSSLSISTRNMSAHMLMLPLSVLLGLSTTNVARISWIARFADKLASAFALKQGKMVADYLTKGASGATFALRHAKERGEMPRSGDGSTVCLEARGDEVSREEVEVSKDAPTLESSSRRLSGLQSQSVA